MIRIASELTGSDDTDQDLGMSGADDIAVGELPILDGRPVDQGAVGGTEVRQHGRLAVPPDLDVAARDTGVGQAEVRVLAAADDVAALP